jgi:NADPH-dependent ferric siderophore reductase
MPTLVDASPLIKSLRDAVFLSAKISEIEQLTPRLRRIRFDGPRLQELKWAPGQHIRLQVNGLGESLLRLHPHDALRTYSIYDADPDLGTLDIVMLDHGGEPDVVTPARRWAGAAAVGDDVQFTRPQGNLVVCHDAPYHVFSEKKRRPSLLLRCCEICRRMLKCTVRSRWPTGPTISSWPDR